MFNWEAGTWTAPPSNHQLFVLPTFSISSRNCTPFSFPWRDYLSDNEVRSAYALWSAGAIPTQCGNDLTQAYLSRQRSPICLRSLVCGGYTYAMRERLDPSILTLFNSGPYSLDSGPHGTAALTMDKNNDTISCIYDFETNLPFEVVVTNVP